MLKYKSVCKKPDDKAAVDEKVHIDYVHQDRRYVGTKETVAYLMNRPDTGAAVCFL